MRVEQSDSLLMPYLQASDEVLAQSLLQHLIAAEAEPIINKIIGYKMRSTGKGSAEEGPHEAEDVHGEVMVQLLQRLRSLKTDDASKPINDFNGYVAVVAYNACDRYVSRKYPQRRRLKNGLRYLLTHRKGFALWKGEHETWLCGLSEWHVGALVNGESRLKTDARRLRQLLDDPRAFTRDGSTAINLSDSRRSTELLTLIFNWVGGPVELDDLVGIVAEWWGIKDQEVYVQTDEERETESGKQFVDQRASVTIEVERRQYLQKLWDEIEQLPARQRAALLLSLRDERGRGIVDLWALTKIATLQDIAGALLINVEEFAGLWQELPLDDNRIAAHLGLTRQQVINLRKSARERLSRRMQGF
ncbi:MAG TPA: hypothetical protein VGO91_10355 [Pyrinomonadaceae bacterium]|jgi:RNA polymerase sigma factor (sigma-70 family)|nr:hypothetical protein [Pyrinomonadaceae bacterium]